MSHASRPIANNSHRRAANSSRRGVLSVLAAVVLAVRNPDPEKVSAYECGFNAFDPFHWLTLWTGASRQTSNRYAM